MGDGPVYWDDDARRRIRRGIYRIEAGDTHGRGPGGELANHGANVHLARCLETNIAGNTVEFQILDADGLKGSEVDNDLDPVEVFIREGVVFEGHVYRIGDYCAGSNTLFEVLNPALRFRAVADATIDADDSGTVSLYYRNANTSTPFYTDSGINVGDVVNGHQDEVSISTKGWVEWEPLSDGSAGWRCGDWDCPA